MSKAATLARVLTVQDLLDKLKEYPADAEVIGILYDDDPETGWMLDVENGELLTVDLVSDEAAPDEPPSVVLGLARY